MERSNPTEKKVSMSTDQMATVYGHVDGVEADAVSGWVINGLDLGNRCIVVALSQGQVVAEVCADLYREDLLTHGIGDGRHAFRLPILSSVVGGEIEIVEKFTGTELIGSPVKVDVGVALAADYKKPAASEPITDVLREIVAGSSMKWQSTAEGATASIPLSAQSGSDKHNSNKEPAKVQRGSGARLNQKQHDRGIGVQLRDDPMPSAASAREPLDLVSTIRDVISKIRSRNNLDEKASSPGEVSISLAEVHRFSDAEAVFFAHKIILGRAPDFNEYRACISALRNGAMSRTRLLEVLRGSPEASNRRVRILHDATERDLVDATLQAKTIRFFYSAEDFGIHSLAGNVDADTFLVHAYRLVLKRDPDPGGMAAYREAMANGTTCSQVLTSMIGSEEFKQRDDPLVILGVTPAQDVLKTLFTATESMMTTIVQLEYQLQTMKNA